MQCNATSQRPQKPRQGDQLNHRRSEGLIASSVICRRSTLMVTIGFYKDDDDDDIIVDIAGLY